MIGLTGIRSDATELVLYANGPGETSALYLRTTQGWVSFLTQAAYEDIESQIKAVRKQNSPD